MAAKPEMNYDQRSAGLDTNEMLSTSKPLEGLRVLEVIPGSGEGKPFCTVRRQVASIAQLGVELRTFYFRSRTSPIAVAREWFRLREEVHVYRPNLIHAHFGTITALVCALSNSVPLVITLRGSDLHMNPDLGKLRTVLGQFFSQLSCLRATRIICVSRNLRNRLWWRRDRAEIIPDGTNLNRFRPQSKRWARAQLDWNYDQPIVVFNGKHQPRLKGLTFVQESVRHAESIIGPIHLELLDVPSEAMPLCLAGADCVLLASAYEGSPNIVREALACNLPVVSTDVGDVAERLKDVYPSKVAKRECAEFGAAIAEVLRDGRPSNGRVAGGLWSETEVAQAIVSQYKLALQTANQHSLRRFGHRT